MGVLALLKSSVTCYLPGSAQAGLDLTFRNQQGRRGRRSDPAGLSLFQRLKRTDTTLMTPNSSSADNGEGIDQS